MAGRGSSPFVNNNYNLRSKCATVGSCKGKSDRVSSVGSRTSSRNSGASHSSRILLKQAEFKRKEELRKLDKEEDDFRAEQQAIDIQIHHMEEQIRYIHTTLNDMPPDADVCEIGYYKEKLRNHQEELNALRLKGTLLKAEEVKRMKSSNRRREEIEESAEIQKDIILDDHEQFLGSDDEGGGLEHPLMATSAEGSANADRTNQFVEDAVLETQRHKEIAVEKGIEESRVQEKAKVEAEKLEIERLLAEQKVQTEKKKEEERKRQEEADRVIAEDMQKQLDLEQKLKRLGTDQSTHTTDKRTPELIVDRDDRFISLLEQVINRGQSSSTSSQQLSGNNIFLARQSYGKELPLFSGKAEEWPAFHADFERSTKDCGFSNSENMSRLRKCLKGGAAEYVRSLMVAPDNVPKVMKQLEIRYGQPDLIIAAMIAKARAIPKFRDDQLDLFIAYGSAVQNVIATVTTLKKPEHMSNPQLLKELEDKLPRQSAVQWLNWLRSEPGRVKSLTYFAEWIEIQTSIACQLCPPSVDKSFSEAGKVENQSKRRLTTAIKGLGKEDIPSAAGLFAGEKSSWDEKRKCIFCEKHYDSVNCNMADRLSLEEKHRIIQEKRHCHICVKFGHYAKACKAFVKCLVCHKKHVTIMCPELHKKASLEENSSGGKSSSGNTEGKIESNDAVETTHSNLACTSKVLLETVMVNVKCRNGTKRVRAMLDSGSQRSYIVKSLVDELELPPIGEEDLRQSLFGGLQTIAKKHNKYRIELKEEKGSSFTSLEVLDQYQICTEIPRASHGSWMKQLKKHRIWISDIGDDSPTIEILIGSNYRGKLLTGEIVQLGNGITAIGTFLGWVMTGESAVSSSEAMCVTSMLVSEAAVSQLWDLEAIGIQDPVEKKSKEEKEVEAKERFLETVTRDNEGRYSVSLPWAEGEIKIPDNRKIAEKRLEAATKKLVTMKQYDSYGKIFKDWCAEGIIEEVHESELCNEGHYIPHRAVFKPESRTTPIRPVFDASCKNLRSPSLNDCLEKGPNLLELIPSIMLKFREGRIGILADIRKAFQMIDVRKEDRDYLRFLWWENYEKKTFVVYRHRRVVFGVNCSPFLLAAVLEHLLTNVTKEETPIAQKVLKSLYVDNLVTSVDTVEEAISIKEWATSTLASAKMELREWEGGTNVQSVVGSHSGCGLDFGTEPSTTDGRSTTSVLGYKWDKLKDELYCDLKTDELPDTFTKRIILSYLQKVYDPIGFTTPVTLQPKLILQKLWEDKIGWDDQLNTIESEAFREWCHQLQILKKIRIPRNFTGGNGDRESWKLHVFCDASKDAYAAVVFLRTDNLTEDNGEERVSVQLLAAKSRVAPLKNPTINRLELLSCYIAVILTDGVKSALGLEDVPIFYWSDSSTALAWIRRNDEWGTFVGNRVRTIIGLSRVDQWRHVTGVHNPADLPSRGCTPSQLLASKWWEGPEWLRRPEEEWPSEEIEAEEDEVIAERKTTTTQVLAVIESDLPWYSTEENGRALSVAELERAEIEMWKQVQQEAFPNTGNVIDGIQVDRKSDGLIYVKTKLLNRADTEEFKYPIILPHNHPLVYQLIWKEHFENHHAGVQFLMSKLREKYWIIRSRRTIRDTLNKCIDCRRFNARRPNVVPAPLPEGRVETQKVFETVGVDLAGPLYTKEGEKAWIVLVTCAVYRCVHLELVMSLSTDSFMDAFCRFTARRGRPRMVYSDNGTNFVGAENALKELDWKKVERDYALQKIEWRFNPPAAPWWGGFWERLVRSVKDLLRKTLGKQRLTYEKLETILIEIEAIINGRPLTVVTEDPEDLIPLTPAMFLHDQPYPAITDRELLEASGFQKLLHGRKTLLAEIKMRFRKEYLALLVYRGKQPSARRFQIGEAVLVGSDDKKRWEWPLARIVELIPGKDGHVRVAKVKTDTGILTRPIQWLFPLEVSPTEEEEMHKARVVTRSGRQVNPVTRYGQT